jgi:uncharacterized membrane protein YdjX (TVP38/TMEM64 family)
MSQPPTQPIEPIPVAEKPWSGLGRDNNSSKNATRTLIVTLLILMVLLFFISKDMEDVKEFIAGSGVFGMLAAIGLYALLGASVVPSEPVTILISTVFGPLNATLVAGIGNTLAAVIEYYLGSKLGDAASFKDKKSKLPWGLGKLPIESPIFLIGGRFMPGYGPKLVSVLGGVYRVPLGRYIWTAAIPTFIGAAAFAYGGFGAFSLFRTIHP